MGIETLETDLLVVGAGMAGMTAAAAAAREGANVVVIEKGPDIGGSAVLSGGGAWTIHADAVGTLPRMDPLGDAALAQVLADDYPGTVQWMEGCGAQAGPLARTDAIQGFPSVVRVIDVLAYIRLCRAEVRDRGGWIVTGSQPESLVLDGGRVVGAEVVDCDGARTRVAARWTLLATGGFQGSPAMRRDLIGEHAAELMLRANPHSDGAGVRLALTAGAALRPPLDAFYGHLMPAPLHRALEPRDFIRLAQIYSPRAILLDRDGRRFADESHAYYTNAVAVSAQPARRALLVADETVRQYDLTAYRGQDVIDRFAEARAEGAHVVEAGTIAELDRAAAGWGYRGVGAALREFNARVAADPDALVPARRAHRRPLDTAPWLAMEVQPAITMTFRGLLIDADARVLDGRGTPVPGLLAAGADACFYGRTYLGGLAMAAVFGRRAARTALDNA
ncbi:MAG: FAD-dependent oxidoreductase [Gammaproteobacteria bacterium]